MTLSNEQQSAMIQELWDREQIRQCVSRYARGVDRFDREVILSAFHPDAIDEHGKFVGTPPEFVEWALTQHAHAHMIHQHCLLNQNCEFEGDSTAYVETYFAFIAMYHEGQPFRMNGGRYIDRFEKRNGEWKIAFRICLRDWGMMDERPDMNDLSSFTSTRAFLSPEQRAFMNNGPASTRDRNDPSYWRHTKPDPERIKAYAKLKQSK
jgi:hypothetical protein